MRYVLFLLCLSFSSVGVANGDLPPGDPRGLIGIQPAFHDCVRHLSEDLDFGITAFGLRTTNPHDPFPFFDGIEGMLLERRQLPTEAQQRVRWIRSVYQPLLTTGIISRAIAEEFRVRGDWYAASVRRSVMEFERDFPTYREQGPFLNNVVERVLHRMRVSNGFVTGFRGQRTSAARAELDRLSQFIVEAPYTRFAELELYVLMLLTRNSHLAMFADSCAWFVPRLLSPYRIWERVTRQLWTPLDTATELRPENRDLQGLLYYLSRSQPLARDLIITRNLPLFSREQLLLIQSQAGAIGLSRQALERVRVQLAQP